MASAAGTAPPAQSLPILFPGIKYDGKSSYGGRGPSVLAVTWLFCSLALIVVALRTYATLLVIRRPRLDLWLMLIAVAFAIPCQAFTTVSVLEGLGNTITKVSIPDVFAQNLHYTIAVCLGQFSICIGKFATMLLIFQIQGKTAPKLKWILYVVVGLNTVMGALTSIIMWNGCDHIPDQWTTNPLTNPKCPRFRASSYITFAFWGVSALTDIVLSIYPGFLFLPLRMSLSRRVGLCILFSGGFAAASIAIYRIVKTNQIGANVFIEDFTKESAITVEFGVIEVWLVLLLSNIPPLRPLIARVTTTLASDSNPLSRISQFFRLSSRSGGSSGPSLPKTSNPSDLEAQKKRKGRRITFGNRTPNTSILMSKTSSKKGTANSQAWSKFSFGFSRHDDTKIESEYDGKESYEQSASWLADNSDADSAALVAHRSHGSIEAPEPAVLPPLPAAVPLHQEMSHHGTGISIERQVDVMDRPRRTDASPVGSRAEVFGQGARPNEPWSS